MSGDSRRRTVWVPLTVASLVFAGVILAGITLATPIRQPLGAITPAAPSGVEGTRIGDTAPDFRLRDIEGVTVTRASLVAGRPGLIFFTATWCLPCIEGLRHLARFQLDVGGQPVNVLVVFVDPRETDRDLRAYRERFGFPRAWHYALDRDGMVYKYRIQYLDTKFILDRSGVIQYTDVRPASYHTWVQALATVGVSR